MIEKEEKIMRLPEVLARFGVSRSTWYAGVKSGLYPRPVRIGRKSVGWHQSVIDALIAHGLYAEAVDGSVTSSPGL